MFCSRKNLTKIILALNRIESKLHRMEITMSQEVDALDEIKAKLADVHDDVKARLDVVAGELSAEGKAEVDAIKDALTAFDTEIGDADGSDTPDTEAPPVAPTL